MTSVAFHVDQLFYRVPGGIGTYVRELVPALAELDPSLRIVLFHARFGQVTREAWMSAFASAELSYGIRRLYPEWALLRKPPLPPVLSSLDLVHAPSPSAIPPAGRPQRLVVTIHDLAFLVHPGLFPRRWRLMFRMGLERAVRSADALIVPSRHTANDLVTRTRADPRRVHVTPLAASLPRARQDVPATLHRLGVRPPYVLCVGNLEPRKNVIRVVRAYRRLALRGVPHRLVLAGPLGWRKEELLSELALPAPGEVVLTGAVGGGDLDALYRGAAVFVYPSLYEGFGLPVLEAMARGVPCVVSSASSLPEVAGDAALMVHPRSTRHLAASLESVVSDGNLAARLSQAGTKRAELFSWEETARRTLRVYTGALEGPAPGGGSGRAS